MGTIALPPSVTDAVVAQTPFFDVYRVGSPALMTEVQRLRYEVYCVERGFLPTGDYPDGVEHDEFDECSVHFLTLHRPTGLPAGTARLVLPTPRGFPMMRHCTVDEPHAFLQDSRDARLLYYREISRVAVSKRYRQRLGDTTFGGPPRAENLRMAKHPTVVDYPLAAGPEIVAGLYKAIYHEARLRGLTHLIAAMERSLASLLRRMDIHFSPIGPERDYYGPVRPYVAAVSDQEVRMVKKHPEVLRYWFDGLPALVLPPITDLVEALLAGRANITPPN